MNQKLIYKILRPAEWNEFESAGIFQGSADDKRDGFIHFSSRTQVSATAHRIFGDEPALVLLALPTETLGDSLRWEPSANGELFPHVYRPLARHEVEAFYQVAGAAEIETTISENP